MSSSKNSNDHRQTTQEPGSYYRPLLQLDNSPSWTTEHSSLAHLGRPNSPPNIELSPSHIQHEVIADDDDDPPTKHEGRILSATPTPIVSPTPRSASSALSPSPPTFHGHTRSPVLARQPTMLENFSRTVRNYVPTSIPVPTAAPSPPRVSRPVSFGSFMGANQGHSPSHSAERESLADSPSDRRIVHHSPSQPFSRTRRSLVDSPDAQMETLGPEDGDVIHGNHLLTGYPTVAEGDNVLWSRWDSLPQPSSKPRRVLFLGYSSGFQMWDCTNLASVSEVLNLSDPSWGHVTFVGVLPPPLADDGQLTSLRPLIGVISNIRGQSVMIIYSLRSYEVVKRLPFHNVSSFASSNYFTVIVGPKKHFSISASYSQITFQSTTNPPTLHVLSSASLTILHTISSSSIFAYSRTSTHKPNTNNIVSLSGIDTHDLDDVLSPDDPAPIYSLSHRLLAFTAQPPRSDSPHGPTALQPCTHTRASSTPFGISQADLGNAAIKVGGSVLSGMKSLGGMAYNAATEYARSRSGMSPVTVTPASPRVREDSPRRLLSPQGDHPASVMSGVSNLFFSRSAPAASGGKHDQVHGPHLRGAATTGDATPSSDVEDGRDLWRGQNMSTSGSYVKILDLGPLVNSRASSHPQVITEFVAAKHQPISHLKFTHDGNALLVGPKDGQVVRIFQLRRRAHVLRGMSGGVEAGYSGGGCGSWKEGKNAGAGVGAALGTIPVPNWTPPPPSSEEDAPWHVYSLRRGRTSAVVQDMEVSPDGRWAAVGTGKGTVHIFAINPYGGQPDLRSHMDTRIWNVDKPQPLSVELTPIARLRSTRATGANGFRSDLSFTFVGGGEMTLPTSLLPPQMASSPSTSSGRSDIPSSHLSHRHHNFKDVLVFDASGGVLSLRRITLEQRPRESGIPFSSPIASLATSISLPGVGAAGRLSASPPTQTLSRDVARKRSGLTQQMLEAATELVGKESTVATWQLKRRYDWREVKRVVHEVGDQPKPGSSNSLAHAELSTCARAPGLVPRSIYLSHQFLFYTLGEDYHALIRRHRLAISGAKIDVRKEVEASAFAGSSEAQFVEDLTFPSDHPHARSHPHSHTHSHAHLHLHTHGGASSFDEPLANAMSADMAYDLSAGGRVTIPMLPNGAAQQSVRARTGTSWSGLGARAALSGMSMSGEIPVRVMEGVGGMIRREMDRVRGGRERAAGAVRGGERRDPLEFDEQEEDFGEGIPVGEGDGEGGGDGEDLWHAWSEEDGLAVDEAERFDDVLGIMDEDQVPATSGKGASAGLGGEW
ncbi:hypothetical protein J3R83DRAFT_75 [Lanmaoa asiatica]|nr:hypothetical protein J3R83DRAFT_75 [Lanmaoa asiatica]